VSVAEAKQRLRRQIRDLRRHVEPTRRVEVGDAVARHVLGWQGLRPGRRVLLHAALPDEVPTEGLMRALLLRGHPILLPRAGPAGRLEFAAITELSAPVEGPFGALEPPSDELAVILDAEDLVLLPGVAFDRFGRRLGRGGGWYDRSLPPDVHDLFGIAFEFQLVDRVPATALDRRVRGVFSERGLRLCDRLEDAREPSVDPS